MVYGTCSTSCDSLNLLLEGHLVRTSEFCLSRVALFLALASVAPIAFADFSGTQENPDRAYPPSCLSVNLSNYLNGTYPIIAFRPVVASEIPASRSFSLETLNAVIQRVPCEAGRSAVLLYVSRQATANPNALALIPVATVAQGPISNQPIRLAREPNTIVSTAIFSPITTDATFVLENIVGQPRIDFDKPFTLTLQDFDVAPIAVLVGAYNSAQYPSSSPMAISGYHAGNWFDALHSGEGAQTEVLEIGAPNTPNNRVMTFAWYTYDLSGVPFWLFGAGVFSQGQKSVSIGMSYSYNGGFAGNFGAAAAGAAWGNVSVQFVDCNTMQFTYQSDTGLPSGVPLGSGSKTWTRASSISGVTCR